MEDKIISRYDSLELRDMFPFFDGLLEEVVDAREKYREAEAVYWHALSRQRRLYASANRIPRHFKTTLLRELEFVGLITDADYNRLIKLKKSEVVAEMRARVTRYKALADKFSAVAELIMTHPIKALVTKEQCRIDSETIGVFQDLINEHLSGVETHGWGSGAKPSWQECYDWAASRKNAAGLPYYNRSLGNPTWTSQGLKRYFQSWCRHFKFTPKEITSQNRPDLKAILVMRGLPSTLDPMTLSIIDTHS